MDLLCLDARRILYAFENLIALRFSRLFFEISTGRRAQISFNLVNSLIQIPQAGLELLPYLGDVTHTSYFPSCNCQSHSCECK